MYLIFYLVLLLMTACALTTIVSFFLYIRARMAERSEYYGPDDDGPDSPDESIRGKYRLINAELDRKERRYRSVHFLSLFIFVVLGVLLLIVIAHKNT